MITVLFQSHEASATSPTGSEYNHALASNGGLATALGSTSPNTPEKANDGTTSTYWQSSSTTGYLSVGFRSLVYVNEVHVTFLMVVYPKLSLYLDTSGNGNYEASEKVWSTTSNAGLNVIINPTTAYALGMRVTIDGANLTAKPKIAEIEAYLRYDTDGDGLTNDQESGTVYYQDTSAGGLPRMIPDDGVNVTTSEATLIQYYGIPARALANFTVDHPRKSDLTVAVGVWNGSAWVDRHVWDPGQRLSPIRITQPVAGAFYAGQVLVTATVGDAENVTKVEFSVNVNNRAPGAAWVSPQAGATVTGAATLRATASDYYGIQKVRFFADGVLIGEDLTADPVTGEYTVVWDTTQYCTNSPRTLSITAIENTPVARSTTVYRQVTTSNDPLVCITTPAAGGTVSGTAYPVRASTISALGITKVEFLVVVPPFPGSPQLRFTDTGAPWEWPWDTTRDPNGPVQLWAKAYNMQGNVDAHVIQVYVINAQCQVGCFGPATGSMEASSAVSSEPTATLGVLTAEWTLGETDSGTRATVVVDLVEPQTSASAAENASRILRPSFPISLFTTYLKWRIVVRDWSTGQAGNTTAFTLRFEVKTDPNLPNGRDTDGDGLLDGAEVLVWHALPVVRDTDLDGLDDRYETTPHTLTVWTGGVSSILAAFTTNPALADTDGDGLTDGQERGIVTTGQSKVIGEVGLAAGVTDAWTKVFLRNKYTSPVVIAQPPTQKDGATGVIRIQSITDHSFQLRFQEWSAVGGHGGENVTYLVLESGNHVLPDGTVIEAGTKSGVGTTYMAVPFRETFAQNPIVLAQIQTNADTRAAAAKIRSVGAFSFETYLRTNPIGTHGTETVGYVAVAPQGDPTSLATWTRLAVSIGSATSGTVSFPKAFAVAPRVLSWFATENSNADVSLRLGPMTNASFGYVRETSATPGVEVLHYFAFAGPANLTARMTTKPTGTGAADTDGDGLSDGAEVNTYGSNPSLKDSDADGIPDNVEVTDRTITIPVNGTMKSFTFKTSPTSDDTDADGIKDPDELTGILDHRALSSDMQTLRTPGILRDLSGNGGDGSILSATCASSVAGKLGYACSFAGSTARIQFADSSLSDLTSSFSIVAWVYPTTTSQPSGAGIVAKGTGGGGESYALDVASGSFRTFFWKGGLSYVAQGTTTFSANTWYLVAAVYDGPAGVLRLYINAGTPVERTGVPASLALNDHVLTIGSRESSAASGYNLGFIGRIDEVSIWDRPLSASEIKGYYNLTSSPTAIVAWLDMETRTLSNDLFDFSGTSHPGVATGTSVVEGRSGFARKFAGGSDGVSLSGSASVTINSGITVDAYTLLSAYPTTDAALVARKASFYLNVSSDGLVRWSLYRCTEPDRCRVPSRSR